MAKKDRTPQEIIAERKVRADRLFQELDDILAQNKSLELKDGSDLKKLATAVQDYSSAFEDLRYDACSRMYDLLIKAKPWKYPAFTKYCKKKFVLISKKYFYQRSIRKQKKKSKQLELFT